jgi:hypothetical protein
MLVTGFKKETDFVIYVLLRRKRVAYFKQSAVKMAGNTTRHGSFQQWYHRKTGSVRRNSISQTLYSSAKWVKFWVKYSSVS